VSRSPPPSHVSKLPFSHKVANPNRIRHDTLFFAFDYGARISAPRIAFCAQSSPSYGVSILLASSAITFFSRRMRISAPHESVDYGTSFGPPESQR